MRQAPGAEALACGGAAKANKRASVCINKSKNTPIKTDPPEFFNFFGRAKKP